MSLCVWLGETDGLPPLTDEPAGSDVATEEGPAGAQAPDNLECLDSSVTEKTGDEATG